MVGSRSPAVAATARDSRRLAGALTCAVAIVAAAALAGEARAEIVAPGIDDGLLALNAKGTPSVAYVRGTALVIATRTGANRWRAARAATVTSGATVMAFSIGPRGPVALVQSSDDRILDLVRRRGRRWHRIRLAGRLPASAALGWPGLVLDGKGLPVVAYTRWAASSWNSQLLLARVAAGGRVRVQRITSEGFPQSFVPPPAAPVFVGGRVHVIEAYGYRGVSGAFEWYPDGRTWTGLGLDVGIGDFPVGPVLARSTASGRVYAAWTQSMIGLGGIPVTLAVSARGRSATSSILLERGLTTALALPASGPEVAANEWVSSEPLDLLATDQVWAGTVVRGRTRVELDGWIAGMAAAPGGARDLLLARPDGLAWFRSPRPLSTRVTMQAVPRPDGTIAVDGQVAEAGAGTVTLYRERPGGTREQVGQAPAAGGPFSFVDSSPVRPFVYRAVYTDPSTGIPYGALVGERGSVSIDDESSTDDEDESAATSDDESAATADDAG